MSPEAAGGGQLIPTLSPALMSSQAIGDPPDQVAYVVAGTLMRHGQGSADHEMETLLPVATTFNVTPESGQGSDLRATEVDTSGALDATALAKSSERGVRIVQGAGVRRLTPRECERLQGFPDDWTLIPGLKCPDSRRYAAMGNAVTVNVAEWVGRRIMAVDRAGVDTPTIRV